MDSSLKTLADLCKLASKFFEDASELITASARRQEILGHEVISKPEKQIERQEKPEKPEKQEKSTKSDKPKSEPPEKPTRKQEKPDLVQNNEKSSKSITQEKPKNSERNEKTGKIYTDVVKTEIKSEDSEKNKSKRKKTEKHKTGYTLYLEKESKIKRNESQYNQMNYGEFSKAMMKLWDSLPASEKEIWNENAAQINKTSTVNYVIPSKNYRSEQGDKIESKGYVDGNREVDEADEETSTKKKRKSD